MFILQTPNNRQTGAGAHQTGQHQLSTGRQHQRDLDQGEVEPAHQGGQVRDVVQGSGRGFRLPGALPQVQEAEGG